MFAVFLFQKAMQGFLLGFPSNLVMVSNYHCIYGLWLLCIWESSRGSSQMEEPVALRHVSGLCIQP